MDFSHQFLYGLNIKNMSKHDKKSILQSRFRPLKNPTPVNISKLMPEYYELVKQAEMEDIPVILSKDEIKHVLKDKHERSRAFYRDFVPSHKKYEIERLTFGLSSDEKELLDIIDEMEPEENAKRMDEKKERDEQVNEKYSKMSEIYQWKKNRRERRKENGNYSLKKSGSKNSKKFRGKMRKTKKYKDQ